MADFAARAFAMAPAVVDYKCYAGIGAYQQGRPEEAIALLEGIEMLERYPEQELCRLLLLERTWAARDLDKSGTYAQKRRAILDEYGARVYFESEVLPLLDALDTEE